MKIYPARSPGNPHGSIQLKIIMQAKKQENTNHKNTSHIKEKNQPTETSPVTQISDLLDQNMKLFYYNCILYVQ